MRPLSVIAVLLPMACAPQQETVEVWCYRTLAEPDCYRFPLPQDRGRLIGRFVVPAPPR